MIFLDGYVYLIRPKLYLANDGNYREGRWSTPWMKQRVIEDFQLPPIIQAVNGQKKTSFGDAVISLNDTNIGIEICEELFTPNSPHIHLGLDGVEIFSNGSASHHELRKLNKRVNLIQQGMAKVNI